MKKLINRILNYLGYIPKEEKYKEFTVILESFGITPTKSKSSKINITFKLGWRYMGMPMFKVESFKNDGEMHQYIFDRGVKAIIEAHNKEVK